MSNNYMDIDEITESMELYNSKPQKICTVFIYFVFTTLVLFLIVSCFVGMEQYEKVQGKIDNMNEEVAVVSNKVGVVERIHISTGQEVKKGDVLISFRKDEETQNFEYYKNRTEDMNEKKSMCYMYLMYLKGQKLDWTSYSGNKYFNEFDSRKNLLESQCRNLSEDNKKTFYESEITKVYAEKTDYENQYIEYKKLYEQSEYTISELEIVAAKDGVVELNSGIYEGNTLAAGQQVANIISRKENNYKIQAYVDEKDIVNLKKNMSIKYDMNAYPAKKYGYIDGKIVKIADKALVNDVDGKNYYLIDIKVTDMNEFENNNEINIKSGMSGTVKVLTSKKKFITIILEKINVIE